MWMVRGRCWAGLRPVPPTGALCLEPSRFFSDLSGRGALRQNPIRRNTFEPEGWLQQKQVGCGPRWRAPANADYGYNFSSAPR